MHRVRSQNDDAVRWRLAAQTNFFDGYFTCFIQRSAPDDPYYAGRIKNGVRALEYYDRAIVDWAATKWPAGSRPQLIHAGAGIGFLAALLAIHGFEVAAFDAYPARADAAKALQAVLTQIIPDIGGRLTFCRGWYPDAVGDLLQDRERVLLFTNVASGWDAALTERIIASFADYDWVVLSLRLFGKVREDANEWSALLNRIKEIAPVRDVAELDVANFLPAGALGASNPWVILEVARAGRH